MRQLTCQGFSLVDVDVPWGLWGLQMDQMRFGGRASSRYGQRQTVEAGGEHGDARGTAAPYLPYLGRYLTLPYLQVGWYQLPI